MRKNLIAVMIAILLPILPGSLIMSSAKSSLTNLVIFSDDFNNLANVYARDYTKTYIQDDAVIINNTNAKLRGFHSLVNNTVEMHLSIVGNTLSYSWWIVIRIGRTSGVDWSDDYGVAICISHNKLKLVTYYDGSFHWTPEFPYLNQNQSGWNEFKIHWDGIKGKSTVSVDGDRLGEFSFFNFPAGGHDWVNYPLAPPVMPGEIEIIHSYTSPGYWSAMNITKVQQYIPKKSKVTAVGGKVIGIGFDTPFRETKDNALPIFEQENVLGHGTINVDQQYAQWQSLSLSYSEDKWMIEKRKWEMGIHYYKRLSDFTDWQSIMDDEYRWVYQNTTYRPRVMCVMQGAYNWTHASYGWTRYRMISRDYQVPIALGTMEINVPSTVMTENTKYIYEDALTKHLRAFFTFTHKVTDNPTLNDIDRRWFKEFVENATSLGYRIAPVYEGYMSLLNAYNATFTIIEDTSERLTFTATTGCAPVYVYVDKPGGSGTCHVYDDKQSEISAEDLGSILGFWVFGGRTYTVAGEETLWIAKLIPQYAEFSSSFYQYILNTTIIAESGTNVTLDIYIPYNSTTQRVFEDDWWRVDCTEMHWGKTWNSGSRVLTIWAISDGSISIRVLEAKPPIFWEVEHSPENPEYDETAIVWAYVTDQEAGLRNMILSYYNGTEWTNVTMSQEGLWYSAMIPPLHYGTDVHYKMYACDNLENWIETSAFIYRVADTTPPEIGVPTWSPEKPFSGEPVVVNMIVSEPVFASGVRSVTLLYGDAGTWDFQLLNMTSENGTWKTVIPGQGKNTTIDFLIQTFDNAGNYNISQLYSYTVSASEMKDLPISTYVIISVIIIVFVGLAIYVVKLKREKTARISDKHHRKGDKPISDNLDEQKIAFCFIERTET